MNRRITLTTADDGSRIYIACDGDPYVVNAIRQVPAGRYDRRNERWEFQATHATAEAILTICERYSIECEGCVPKHFHFVSGWDKFARSRPFPPYEVQARGALMASQRSAAGLFYEMGVGKTKACIDAMDFCGDRRVLVLCPKAVIAVWRDEIAKHSHTDWRVVDLDGKSVKDRAEQLSRALGADTAGRPMLVVVNYEAAWREPLAARILGQRWDRVVLDESHKIKDPRGRASKFCDKLSYHANRRTLLTGTPMPHSPLDVFSQYRFLDRGIFGNSYTAFRSRYAVMGGFEGKQVVDYQNLDELNRRVYSCAIRATKTEVLELPAVHHVVRHVDLGGVGRRVYAQMERAFEADVQGGEVTAANALVRLLRLQQITGGSVPTDDGRAREVDTAKRDMLEEVMSEAGDREPLVVFARFHTDLDQILAAAASQKRLPCEISGRTKNLDHWRREIEDAAIAGRPAPVLAVQITAGGVGIDLTGARYCVLWSTGFSLGDYDQALARVHRKGQEREVTYIHLHGRGTIDEKIFKALDARRDVVESVLADYQQQQQEQQR